MQSPYIPPKAGKVAIQQGLIFGLIQAAIACSILLTNTFVNVTSAQAGFSWLLLLVSFLTSLAAYFVAGIFSAKQTGKVSTGTFAGLWTGAIYGVIEFVVRMMLFFQVNLPKALDAALSTNATAMANPEAFKAGLTIGGVFVGVLGLFFAIGLGAGLGALGGLIGKSTSKVQAAVPMVPAYMVYPGQPVPYAPYAAPVQPSPYAQPVNQEQPGIITPDTNPYTEHPY